MRRLIVSMTLVFALTGPAFAGGFQLPNLGLLNFLAPLIRGFFLLLLRVVFLIPGGEDFLIDLL